MFTEVIVKIKQGVRFFLEHPVYTTMQLLHFLKNKSILMTKAVLKTQYFLSP